MIDNNTCLFCVTGIRKKITKNNAQEEINIFFFIFIIVLLC